MAECAQLEADLEATQREAVRLALVSSCSTFKSASPTGFAAEYPYGNSSVATTALVNPNPHDVYNNLH